MTVGASLSVRRFDSFYLNVSSLRTGKVVGCRAAVWPLNFTKNLSIGSLEFEGSTFVLRIDDYDSYLVDPASSHMLVSKIKPCMSKYKPH